MNKTKIRNISLLFTLLLFIASLAFSVVTLFKANADTVEDVEFNFVDHSDLTKETESVYGTTMETYGNVVGGWGGWLKYLKINNENGVDASAIAATGKGALSFWLYIADEGTRDAYKDSTQTKSWNVDVCSAASYNDTNKYSFNVANNACAAFQNVRVGWQRVVLPFSAADEKNSIDWTTVRHFRFNTNVPGGKNNIKVGGFSFTTTNLPKYTITGDPATTFGYTSISGVDTEVMNIADLGESFTAFYNKDKGGFLTVLALDKAYSVNVAADSALSLWVYFDRETDKGALSYYNVDISSGASYSDSHKYSFNIKNLFSKCAVGWNQLIIPLENADEKNGMDWTDVRNIRLNVGGGTACRVAMTNMQIIHSGVTAPTVVGYVEPTEPEPDLTVTLTKEGGLVAFSGYDGMTAINSISQLDSNTTAQYVFANSNGSWNTYGGMVRATVLDKPYNVSAISSDPKGAFVFWLYVNDQTTLNLMQTGKAFNLNLSSTKSFSDAKKWEYNIAPLAEDMMIGWNKIVIPFNSSMCAKPGGGAENATVENIRFVALDGAGGGQANVAFADFGFFLTDETAPCVINRKTQMTRPDDVTFSIENAADFTADNELLTGKTAYSAIGKNWGAKTQTFTLAQACDLGDHEFYGKAVLTFKMYFEDETTLEAYRSLTSGYTISLGSGDAYSSSAACTFDIAGLFGDCSVGWNTISLPIGTADANTVNWENVKFITLSWTKAFGEGECEVAFAEFAFISTDETTRSVESESGISLSVKSVAEFDKATLVRSKKNVSVFSIIEKGWGRFDEKQITLAKSYDASKFTENGALAFWLYIENEATLNGYKGMTGGWKITVYSGAYQSATKLTFALYSLFDDCIVGWNYLVLPFAQGTNANLNFSAISHLSIEVGGDGKDGTADSVQAGNNRIAITQFSIVVTDLTQMTVAETISNIEEGLNPIEERVIIDCNNTNGLLFPGNKVDSQDHRYESGCVYTSGPGYALNAQFEAGETDLRKNTIVLAFWLWIEDPAFYFESDGTTLKSNINGQIELSSNTAYDKNEINWELRQWGVDKFEKGWNWVVLKGADGNISGGDPNFDELIRFRIYVNGIEQSTMKIDRITIGSGEKLLTAPDWEKEVIGGGDETGFKGANKLDPANDPYLELDFNGGAKDFTTIVIETVKTTKTEDGCASSLSVLPVAFILLIGASAVCVLVVRKRKNDTK